MEKTSARVVIETEIENVDGVIAGLNRIGDSAGNVGERISRSSGQADISFKRLSLTTAGLIGNSVQLADIGSRMASGQLDLSRGALLLSMNFMQLASQIYTLTSAQWASISAGAAHVASMVAQKMASLALTIVEHARAIAHFVANAVSSLGIAVPVMLGAAAAAAGLYFGSQGMAEGGIVTGPTIALIGESGPEAVIPLSKMEGKTPVNVTINVYETRDARTTARETVDELRRRGII